MGLKCFKPHGLKHSTLLEKKKSTKRFRYILSCCFFVYIICYIITYKLQGIPLFLTSRLDLYAGSGGLGVLGRITEFMGPYLLILVYYELKYYRTTLKRKRFLIVCIIIEGITMLLSGSKGALIGLFTPLFILGFICDSSFLSQIKHKGLIITGLILIAFIIISIQSTSEDLDVGLHLLQRIISAGDIYFLSYPNDAIMHVKGNWIDFLLGPILKTFRLIKSTELPIGNQIFQIWNDSGINGGPNSRINVMSLVCFGPLGGAIFCFLGGLYISFIRNYLSRIIPNNPILFAIYGAIYSRCIGIQTDPTQFINNCVSVFIGLCLLLIIIWGIYYLQKRKSIESHIKLHRSILISNENSK